MEHYTEMNASEESNPFVMYKPITEDKVLSPVHNVPLFIDTQIYRLFVYIRLFEFLQSLFSFCRMLILFAENNRMLHLINAFHS